jgi:hypothetical protein
LSTTTLTFLPAGYGFEAAQIIKQINASRKTINFEVIFFIPITTNLTVFKG